MDHIKRDTEDDLSPNKDCLILPPKEIKKSKQSFQSNISATETMKIKFEDDKSTENVSIDDNFLRKWTEEEDLKHDHVIKSKNKLKGSKEQLDFNKKPDKDDDECAENIDIDDHFLRKWTEKEDLKHDHIFTNSENEFQDSNKHLNIKQKQPDDWVKGNKKKVMTNPKVKLAYDIDRLIEELCRDVPVSEKVINLCEFKCPKCSKVLPNLRQFKTHLNADSKCKTEFCFLDIRQFISSKTCHVCKFCSAKILCDNFIIARHVSNKHETPLAQYKKQFNLENPKVLRSIDCYSDKILGNLCVYQCEKCLQKFSTERRLNIHQKTMFHGKNMKKVIKSTYHKCRLCKETILCETVYLQHHMKGYHKITLPEYCAKTKCEMQQTKKMLKLKTLKISAKVYDSCVFACRICNEHFYSQCSFLSHKNSKKHHLTPPQPPISDLESGSSYRCTICSRLMLCDRNIIQSHMKQYHHVVFDMKLLTQRKVEYQRMCDDFVQDLPISVTVQDKMSVPACQIPINEITATIGNLCQFMCPYCDTKIFCSWYFLTKHVKSIHHKKLFYSSSIVSLARYHSCLICPKAILSDRFILLRHLCKRHTMPIRKYEEIFVKHGGKVLPTYQTWLKTYSNSLDHTKFGQ